MTKRVRTTAKADDGRCRDEESRRAGAFFTGCVIDLPPDDVVESIDFERFFRLTYTLGDMLASAVPSIQTDSQTRSRAARRGAVASETNANAAAGFVGPTPDAYLARLESERKKADQEAAENAARRAADPLSLRSMALALHMPFRQEWQLEGYTRGRMVNSFSLAPGEEQTVEIFTWDRVVRSTEITGAYEREDTSEGSGTRRDTTDVARDVARQTGFELTTGGKVAFTVGVVSGDATAGASARTAVNEAGKETLNAIVEATAKSSGRVRSSRSSKVVESRETGREERVTRSLRNDNTCHTLTIPFFEVLANYCVTTQVQADEVRVVALIPSAKLSALRSFTRRNVRQYESSLRSALLDRRLEDGFAAARLLDARERACGILCAGCACDDRAAETTSNEWRAVVAAASAVVAPLRNLVTTPVRFPGSALEAVAGIAAGVADISRYLFLKSVQSHAPRLLLDLAALGIDGNAEVSAMQAERVAQVWQAVPAADRSLLAADAAVSVSVSNELFWYFMRVPPFEPIAAGIKLGLLKANTSDLSIFDDAGLVAALNAFETAYANWANARAEARKNDARLAELDRIAAEERQLQVLSAFGLLETATAAERLEALLDHLNDERNLDHYRFAAWNERSVSTDETVMSLALAGHVDPTPVGVVGDNLAVPVRLRDGSALTAFFLDSVADLITNAVREQRRQILPTAALYAEAIVGACNSCEDERADRSRLDLRALELANSLTELEIERLLARLHAEPPLLDGPSLNPPTIKVEVGRLIQSPDDAPDAPLAGSGAPAEVKT